MLAIIITIMVLEIEVPREPTFQSLGDSSNGLLTYLLSFVYLGIYWLEEHEHLSPREVADVLEHHSGLTGLAAPATCARLRPQQGKATRPRCLP